MLQKLPAELRSYIYELAFTGPDGTNVLVVNGFQKENLVQPPLTRTGKQVRDESLPIYYGKTMFKLDLCCDECLTEDRGESATGWLSTLRWLSTLSPLHRSQLGLAIVRPEAVTLDWEAKYRSIDQRLDASSPPRDVWERLRALLAGLELSSDYVDHWVGKHVHITFK